MSAIREAANRLCLNFPGGYDGMAVAIGVSSGAMLRQKVLGHKGARLDVDELVAMQSACNSSSLVDAFARESGGVFVQLPNLDQVCNQEIARSFAKLSARVGKLAGDFGVAVSDEEVDKGERQLLESDAQEVAGAAMELVAMIVAVHGNAAAREGAALVVPAARGGV